MYDVSFRQLRSRGGYIISTEVYAVHDRNDTVEIKTLILAGELPYLDCDRRREGTSGSLNDDTSGIIFICNKLDLGGKVPFSSSKASAILPTCC